ncbi:MAG: hypothetical protein HYR66_08415, partial [Sphingobacteriales bacterium]|nr:hypothetical protein [Sphingobacteriales bacterium]
MRFKSCFIIIFLLHITFCSIAQQLRLVVPVGHTGEIADACFSPNGKLLVTVADDNTIKIWDISSGRLFQTLYGHKAAITQLLFIDNGNYLITSSYEDGNIKIWDIKSGEEKINYNTEKRFTKNIHWLASVVKKKMMILDGESIKVWEVETGKLDYTVNEKATDSDANPFDEGAVSNDKKTVAAITTYGDSLFVWDITSHKLKGKFLIERIGYKHSIKFSPDDKYLYLLTEHGFEILDISNGKKKFESVLYGSLFMKPKFSANMRYLFTASKYDPMRESGIGLNTDVNDNKNFAPAITEVLLHKTTLLKGPVPDGNIKEVEFDNSGNHLFVSTSTGFYIYTITGNQYNKTGQIKENNYNYVPVFYTDPDGRYILKTTEGVATLYNIKGERIHLIKGNISFEPNQYFSNDGKFIYTTSGNAGKYSWDISGGKFTSSYDTSYGLEKGKDESNIIKPYSFLDTLTGIWKVVTGKDTVSLKGKMNYIPTVTISNTKKFIAGYRTGDSLLRIWSAAGGDLVHQVFCKYGSPESVAFGKNDSLLIWGSGNAYINSKQLDKMWDDLQKELDNTDTAVNKDVIKEDTVVAETGNARNSCLINIISLATGKPVFEVEDSTLPRSYIRTGFSDSFKYFDALTGFITIWDSKTFRKVISVENNCTNWLPGWAISADGQKVLISCDNSSALYESYSNKLLFTLPGAVSFADFSEDGKYILTEAPDKQLKIWSTVTGKILYTYYALENGSYLLTDEYGRYDG